MFDMKLEGEQILNTEILFSNCDLISYVAMPLTACNTIFIQLLFEVGYHVASGIEPIVARVKHKTLNGICIPETTIAELSQWRRDFLARGG